MKKIHKSLSLPYTQREKHARGYIQNMHVYVNINKMGGKLEYFPIIIIHKKTETHEKVYFENKQATTTTTAAITQKSTKWYLSVSLRNDFIR